MKASRLLLEMLRGYEVSHVFGLPGETTLPLYEEWLDFPEIRHVVARDERSASFMAEGYAKFSFKPGVCEAPSVGATHVLPGCAEAYKGATPIVFLVSDIPLDLEPRNMLTGLDQSSLFSGITKESLTLVKPQQVSHLVRRAFRVATTGRPGPVHIRLPMDVLGREAGGAVLPPQREYASYPGARPVADPQAVFEALRLLGEAERPVLVCGQGVLLSQAWDEVVGLAEAFAVPVGTTINGKGGFPEGHPLSLGVVGARGGTETSNRFVQEADLVFFVGCSTDSAATDAWRVPPVGGGAKVVQLDISPAEAGNNYASHVTLVGDAKATLGWMLELLEDPTPRFRDSPRVKALAEAREQHQRYVEEALRNQGPGIHPLALVKTLENTLPRDGCMVMDVGTAAIYTSTYFRVREAGRRLAYNFAMGSLGYALPAAMGASLARPGCPVASLVGDGSFGLVAAELETLARYQLPVTVVLINNGGYGWIRAEWLLSHGERYVDFATNFNPVDHVKVAEGFGVEAARAESPGDLEQLGGMLGSGEPRLLEVVMEPEDKLIPPVPKWIKAAQRKGLPHLR